MVPNYSNLYYLLDAAKVADSVVFILSAEDGIDDYGQQCLSCLFSQGLPASLFCVQVRVIQLIFGGIIIMSVTD